MPKTDFMAKMLSIILQKFRISFIFSSFIFKILLHSVIVWYFSFPFIGNRRIAVILVVLNIALYPKSTWQIHEQSKRRQ